MRIGIFFGGPSREREISFAGGKTAMEHLDKTLFEPVPIFVDSFGRFIRLRPELIYSDTIRDFFPSPELQPSGFLLYAESFPELREQAVEAAIGELIAPATLTDYIDFAFLAMHGPDCEDGAIQGLLEWHKIPYSGPGLMGSSVGIDKVLQNEMIALVNGQEKETAVLRYEQWQDADRSLIFEQLKTELGLPIVVKAPHQGSSIGVAIVQKDDFEAFELAVNQCFFQVELFHGDWISKSAEEKKAWAQKMANMDEGIGYPLLVQEQKVYKPDVLISVLDTFFEENSTAPAVLLSSNAEDQVLFETFVRGQEFSCGCIQLPDGTPLALPPTEIVKVVEVFDFNSKYKPGATRKRIPVDTTTELNQKIRDQISRVFSRLGMNVCARIDGFLTPEGDVLLHDPNTIPGMSPTSLIFKQMAEVGLNVTQSITYFIRQSLRERIRTGKNTLNLRQQLLLLDESIAKQLSLPKPSVGLVFEATDAAYAKARKKFGQIGAEGKQIAIPFLKLSEQEYIRLPVQLMFKDFVEDLLEAAQNERNDVLSSTSEEAFSLTAFFAGIVQFDCQVVSDLSSIEKIEEWINLD
ncbi:D-alanine--D-alanine ligase family protein [Arundinibacter roseus]|uniref:D-alanine--D-alanine ligase n=1 Tax=Arundinibacter roseus TaxID=2070510 RepID=A0A4R4KB73_9BACT|nr:D-alanine--D-alanine ligase [Arundinibacter roseus]TDB65104.1 D-alanine--D-alanine ligase [Arundinibacter roseus]